jgi:hypothetical protein
MAKKGGAAGGGEGGGSKKAQGQARKADAAASKQAAKDKQVEVAESKEWDKGAKSNAKACVYTMRTVGAQKLTETVRPPPRRSPKLRARKPRKKPFCAKKRPLYRRSQRARHPRPRRNLAVSTPRSDLSRPSLVLSTPPVSTTLSTPST